MWTQTLGGRDTLANGLQMSTTGLQVLSFWFYWTTPLCSTQVDLKAIQVGAFRAIVKKGQLQ